MQATNIELATTVVKSIFNSVNVSNYAELLYALHRKCVGFNSFAYYLRQWLKFFRGYQVRSIFFLKKIHFNTDFST